MIGIIDMDIIAIWYLLCYSVERLVYPLTMAVLVSLCIVLICGIYKAVREMLD